MNLNIYNPYVRRELELYHHGILGQKWGKRNGPPYPLGVGDHSANENKAGWRDSLSGNSKSKSNRSLKIDSNKVKKAVIVGSTVAVTALAAVGAYQLYKSGALEALTSRGKGIADEMFKSASDKANLKKINPNFLTNPKHQMNCGNCVIANELVKRGEQNITAGDNLTGMTTAQLGTYFKGLKSESFFQPEMHMQNFTELPKEGVGPIKLNVLINKRGKEISNFLKDGLASQFPKGSRGAMFVPTFQGSHWISWKISDTGKVEFENPQWPGLNIENFLGKYMYPRNIAAASLTGIRLDDAEIDMSRIGEVVNMNGKTSNLFETFFTTGNNFVLIDKDAQDMYNLQKDIYK